MSNNIENNYTGTPKDLRPMEEPKKKYSGVLSLAFEVQFDDPDAKDLTDHDIVRKLRARVRDIVETGTLREAVGHPEDIEENQ